MKIPTHNFNRLAPPSTAKKPKETKLTPFSLRLTFEERAQLEQDAADMALGAYIRERLFGEDVAPRKTRGKAPVKDYEALGRVLGALGSSRLSSNLNQLAIQHKGGAIRHARCLLHAMRHQDDRITLL